MICFLFVSVVQIVAVFLWFTVSGQPDSNTADQSFSRRSQNLTGVPDNIPSYIRNVDLSHNFIIEIKSYAFKNLNECVALDLSKNLINHLESETFVGLYNLEELRLKYNNLTALRRNVFEELLKLRKLVLEQVIRLYG